MTDAKTMPPEAANPPSKSRVRALSGTADQIFSSLGNGLILYAVAVVTASDTFGRIALLMTLLTAAIGLLRGALGTPLLLAADRSMAEIRDEGGHAVTTALLVSPVVAAAMWFVAGSDIRTEVIILMVATPVVLVQDVLRYVAIAEGRPQVAALWDGVWFVGSAVMLVTTWVGLRFATSANLLGVWGILALVALIGLLIGVRVRPRVGEYRAWLADGWQHRVRYGTEAGLEQTTVFAVMLFVTVALTADVTAALRGAMALMAPVAILTSAIPLVIIPESTRLTKGPAQVWRSLVRVSLVTSTMSLLIGLGIYLLPRGIGELALGATFDTARVVIPVVAVEYAIGCWVVAVTIYLRAFNRSADALLLKVSYVAIMLMTALGAAVLFRSASGVAVGMATATTFIALMSILWFRPWAPSPGRGIPAEPSGTPHAARTGSIAALLRPGSRELPASMDMALAQRVTASNALIMLWTGASLVLFVPVAVIRYTGVPDDNLWWWSVPVIVIAGARFGWLVGNGERRLFEMMYWGFAYAFLGLAPLAQLRIGDFPVTVPRMDATLTAAGALISIVGCCAFLAGALLDGALVTRAKTVVAETARLFTVDHAKVLVMAVFAIVWNMYYLANVGWIQFLKSREEAFEAYDVIWRPGTLGVMVRACSYMALLVAFVALVRFRREAKYARQFGHDISPTALRVNLVLIVVVGVLLANSMNPISNARYLSGTAILAAATALGLFATIRRYRVMAVSFLLGLTVLFPLADAFRYSSEAEFKAANPLESLLSADYDSFAQIMNGYLVAERDGIVPLRQFSGVVLFAFPRSLWPDKPVDTGIYIANQRGYLFTNLSAPLWIELFLNGGWVLLVGGMFALGLWLHRIDTRLNQQFNTYGMPGIVGSILPFYTLILLRGSLLQAGVVPVLHIAVRVFRPPPPEGGNGTGRTQSRRTTEAWEPPCEDIAVRCCCVLQLPYCCRPQDISDTSAGRIEWRSRSGPRLWPTTSPRRPCSTTSRPCSSWGTPSRAVREIRRSRCIPRWWLTGWAGTSRWMRRVRRDSSTAPSTSTLHMSRSSNGSTGMPQRITPITS